MRPHSPPKLVESEDSALENRCQRGVVVYRQELPTNLVGFFWLRARRSSPHIVSPVCTVCQPPPSFSRGCNSIEIKLYRDHSVKQVVLVYMRLRTMMDECDICDIRMRWAQNATNSYMVLVSVYRVLRYCLLS